MSAKWQKRTDYGRLTYSARQAQRTRILNDEPLCRHCQAKGRVTAATEIDHIVPLSKGGSNDDSNQQPLCKTCHKIKTAKDSGKTYRPMIGIDGYPIEG
jgi:5-methylcytosine-specific restriction enzyme A